MSGYKGIKASTSYSDVQKLLAPQLADNYYEFEFVDKFWSDDETWQEAVRGNAFKGARNFQGNRAPATRFKQDPLDSLSFPFIWNMTGFAYQDKAGTTTAYFIDDKFYHLSIDFKREYEDKGTTIIESMVKKYGQPCWEVCKKGMSMSRCVWENTNGVLIATLRGLGKVNYSECGKSIEWNSTTGSAYDCTIVGYGLVTEPMKDGYLTFMASKYLNPIKVDVGTNEIPMKGRMLAVGVKMRIDRDGFPLSFKNKSLDFKKAYMSKVNEFFSQCSIVDSAGKKCAFIGSIIPNDIEIMEIIAFYQAPSSVSRMAFQTPEKRPCVFTPSDPSCFPTWIFLGPLPMEVVTESEFNIVNISYFSREVRQYVEKKINSVGKEQDKARVNEKKKAVDEVSGF